MIGAEQGAVTLDAALGQRGQAVGALRTNSAGRHRSVNSTDAEATGAAAGRMQARIEAESSLLSNLPRLVFEGPPPLAVVPEHEVATQQRERVRALGVCEFED